MNNPVEMISTVEARVMMLEQKNDAFHQTLKSIESRMDRIESKIDKIEDKMDSGFIRLENMIDNNFKWTMKSTFGLYTISISAMIGIIIKLVWG